MMIILCALVVIIGESAEIKNRIEYEGQAILHWRNLNPKPNQVKKDGKFAWTASVASYSIEKYSIFNLSHIYRLLFYFASSWDFGKNHVLM